MRTRRYGVSRRPRKVRPNITVKVKPARRNGTCSGCGASIYKGDETAHVRHRIKRFHPTCVPANVNTPTGAAVPPPTDPHEAALASLVALENALMQKAKRLNYPDDLEKAFSKYSKIKEHVMRPGSEQEGKQALKLAVLELVKAVF